MASLLAWTAQVFRFSTLGIAMRTVLSAAARANFWVEILSICLIID